MNIYLVNAENIYFPQIKEYFHEIISSYDNGNYRSSMVMLYSTVVCDLLLKLKELSDVFNDAKAEKILKEVNEERMRAGNSTWEWNLIKKVNDRTELLSFETYKMIEHVYDLRNISAHPAMNEDYELISPTSELTIAYIKKCLDDIFIKPSVFAQSIVDRMSDDLAEKSTIFGRDYALYANYLKRIYFSRMSDKMVTQVYRAFWKFSFKTTDAPDITKNRRVNCYALLCLYQEYSDLIIRYIADNTSYFSIASDKKCLNSACLLLAHCPKLYSVLDDTTRLQIEKHDDTGLNLIKWFISGDLKAHVDSLLEENRTISTKYLKSFKKICATQGEPKLYNTLIISNYANSDSFSAARDRYNWYVRQNLQNFLSNDFVALLSAINNNPQIYGYNRQTINNDEILAYAKNVLPNDYDYSQFPHFEYTSDPIDFDEIQSSLNDEEDTSLPDENF